MGKQKKQKEESQINQGFDRIIRRKQFEDLLNSGKLLIILFSGVYDVSEYKNIHPGGNKILQKYKGKDASEKFVQFGHMKAGPNMIKMLTKFRIGKLKEDLEPKL